MDKIHVKLFSTPQVFINNKKVFFPLRKAEALLYYLIVNKQATRDELAALLWGEYDDRTAKKYLRNAMYRVRKACGLDVLISPQTQVVMINPSIRLESDLDFFSRDHLEEIQEYLGEFLQGFWVNDAENFIEWTRNKADFFRELYIKKLYQLTHESLKEKDDKSIEHYARLIIQVDEFDESAYRILMELYAGMGAFNKAIRTYNHLLEVLDRELGITPDKKTNDLYLKILDLRNAREVDSDERSVGFFYGRHNELNTLRENYHAFINNQVAESLIIIGEAGIGKTKLKDEFIRMLDVNKADLIETDCYQAEERYILKPWNTVLSKVSEIVNKEGIDIPVLWGNIISNLFPSFATEFIQNNVNPVERLDTLKFKVIEDTIISLLSRVSQNKKIVLIFEDLQWIDRMSLSLLSGILLHNKNNNIFFIGTLRTGYSEEIDRFVTFLSQYNKLKRMEIDRFTREETEGFVSKALPGFPFTSAQKEKLYKETEGNTFFIIEYLNIIRERGNINIMTSRMQDILKSRIIDISDEGKKILNIISVFFDEISLEILKKVSGKSEIKIMDIIEELKGKFIIKEVGEVDRIGYIFTHQKLREYIYSNQSLGRRRILHNKIGLILEGLMKNDKHDVLLYPNLIYHFTNARNGVASLQYSIKNAKVYLDFSHELFPELRDSNARGDEYLQITKNTAIKYMDDIAYLLEKVKSKEGISDEIIKLEVEFLHMRGRYLIREGEYEDGVKYIQKVIQKALKINDYKYVLKGYIQMIFFSIQTHQVDLMEKNLGFGLDLAMAQNHRKEIGILLRLKGLNKVMIGQYREAEVLLKESIEIFSNLNKDEDKYSLSIAAAYNYIGEIRKCNKCFSDAITYYDKAISISTDKKALSSLAIFNTNAGQAAYENGDYSRAKKYFKEALRMYNQFDTIWGRSTAEGYSALLFVKDGRYKSGLKCLKNADQYSKKLKSPYERGLVYRVMAEIRASMKSNKTLNDVFKIFLNQDIGKYCDQGVELFEKTKKSYERDFLNDIRNRIHY